ncbi:BNR-4 repeat-containing protein [Vibrio hippocampi]|uniref:Ulvan Lyase-PL25 n=1 Tax=Vibrio hippocampi TaxID=654686 RepID=A0ABN8DIB2_9VIBR|nr:BNR-4 repeat-containing protein [Vibrio hippocampi]CAH0528792.1 Ulvan Lyase-PL25 [Vibrio hippocampi]
MKITNDNLSNKPHRTAISSRFKKHMLLSSIILSVGTTPFSTLADQNTTDKEQMVDYFANNGFGNSLAIVQAPAGIYENGITYLTYQGDLEDPYVVSYNHETKEWQGPIKAGFSELGKDNYWAPSGRAIDNHGKPTMIIDDLGYIHIFFGGHGGSARHGDNPLGDVHDGKNKHIVSKKPHDISDWLELDNIPPFGNYNQAVKMDNGDIYLFYRHGAHESDWVYQKSTDHGRTFEEPVSFLKHKERDDVDAVDSWYAWAVKGQGDDIIITYDYHLCWKTHANNGRGHTTERHNAYYMVFDTKNDTWRNVKGETFDLPVTRELADEKTLALDTKDKWTFNGSVHLDQDGNPHIGTNIGVDLGVKKTGGPKQTSHVTWTGEEWVGGNPVNPSAVNWGVDTRGDFFISSPQKVTFALGYKEKGDGVISYFSSEDGGETFAKGKELLRKPKSGWSISAMITNAHPDARLFVAEKARGEKRWRKMYLLGDNGPIQRSLTDANTRTK